MAKKRKNFETADESSSEKIKEQPSHDDDSRYHLHTTISMSSLEKLQTLTTRFGSFSKTIEKAIDLLSVQENLPPCTNKQVLDNLTMWHLMRSELNMVAVGKTTYLSYINEMPRKALVENNAVEIIEWFYDFKDITELSTEAILFAIKKIWISANYFREVRIEKVTEGHFRVVITHDLNDIKYSEFWAAYFQVLFTEKLQKLVKTLIRPQIFHLDIQETNTSEI